MIPQTSAYHYPGSELEVFQHAKNWKSYYGEILRPWIQGEVLEVGAGYAATTPTLVNSKVKKWHLLEPDPQNFLRLQTYLPSLRTQSPSVQFFSQQGNLSQLGSSQVFDTVCYIDVLEHIQNDQEELQRAETHLKPGGFLVVLSPAHQFLFSPFDQAIGHFRRYTKNSLLKLLSPRLRPHNLFYLDSVGFLASLANRLFLKSAHPTNSQIQLWDRYMVPASRLLDPVIGRSFGKTVILIAQRI